jgi:tetratricopeptide (TPR) repeat protein
MFQHIVDGRHTALLGRALDLDDSYLVRLVRVRCDRGDYALAPLLEAKTRIERLLGLAAIPDTDDHSPAARFRPLGEGRESWNARLVALFNQFRDTSEQPAALLLESVQDADPDTLRLLEHMVKSPSWMRLPLVLEFRSPPIEEAAKSLLEAVERFGGSDCVFRSEAWCDRAPSAASPQTEPEGAATDDFVSEGALAPDVRRVLRAGAVLGPHFSADTVAKLVNSDPLHVLDLLQAARDAGVAVEDDGEGGFRLPRRAAEKLHRELLPSLAREWHRRAAEILASVPAGTENGAKAEPPSTPHRQRTVSERPARAAEHAEAAGEDELAARQYALAGRQAASVGAFGKALAFQRKALDLLATLPPTEHTRLARARVLLDAGRASFMGIGDSGEFSLTEALGWLDSCRTLLRPGDPVELRAELAATTAAVCYDIGEPDALAHALSELSEASVALVAAARPFEAARLLNDEAAVRVRLGQLEAAERLLAQSRELFAKAALTDPRAAAELAETNHLEARLVLHADPKRIGRTSSLERAIECARRADAAYATLGMAREQARVWETLGRLERLAGRREHAAKHLTAAFEEQRTNSDAIGLARSTAALAELAADRSDWQQALRLLTVSIGLNQEKGSALGLSVNRDTLDVLRRGLGSAGQPELFDRMHELESALDRSAVG